MALKSDAYGSKVNGGMHWRIAGSPPCRSIAESRRSTGAVSKP